MLASASSTYKAPATAIFATFTKGSEGSLKNYQEVAFADTPTNRKYLLDEFTDTFTPDNPLNVSGFLEGTLDEVRAEITYTNPVDKSKNLVTAYLKKVA